MKSIAVIGVGSLGTHMTRLLCRNKLNDFLAISDKDLDRANLLGLEHDIEVMENEDIIRYSDVLFLTVKPNHMKEVCDQIRESTETMRLSSSSSWPAPISMSEPKTIITAAAGVPVSKVKEWTGGDHVVIRCMPNIPISVGDGSIVWYGKGPDGTKEFLEMITDGPNSVWVEDETMMAPATVISGCSPAYIAKFYQTYVKIGMDMGFTEPQAKSLMMESMKGTLKFLDSMGSDEIMNQVASKGGATEKGLKMLDEDGFTDIIRKSAFFSLEWISKITKSL